MFSRVIVIVAGLNGFGRTTAASLRSSVRTGQNASWKPEPCDELPPGVPCVKLYEHPQGSGLVTTCPMESVTSADGCAAYFGDKADGAKCPQLDCPKALGVHFKLVCAGGCCPTCWAPDHVLKLDRHTVEHTGLVVDPAPGAPPTCAGVQCFEPVCAEGFTKGFVQGNCCYSCVAGR